jgi:hypothetical protein
VGVNERNDIAENVAEELVRRNISDDSGLAMGEEQYCEAHAQGFRDGIGAAAAWLRHSDRLDQIPGATLGLPHLNPLWDASMKMEEKLLP